MGVHRDALGRINQQVLQGGRAGLFAADAERGAAGSLSRLLALIAVHLRFTLIARRCQKGDWLGTANEIAANTLTGSEVSCPFFNGRC